MFKGAALGAMLGASIGPASIPAKDPRLEKFSKMLRMHMPEGAVMLKMQAEGFDPALLGLGQPATTSKAAAVEDAKDPRLEKFSKMLRMHMPEGAVMLKMQAEGFDPALLGLGQPA